MESLYPRLILNKIRNLPAKLRFLISESERDRIDFIIPIIAIIGLAIIAPGSIIAGLSFIIAIVIFGFILGIFTFPAYLLSVISLFGSRNPPKKQSAELPVEYEDPNIDIRTDAILSWKKDTNI